MKTALCALAVLLGTFAFAGSASAAAAQAKFDFEDQTFSDGTIGEIYASSKVTGNGSAFTTCDYVDSSGAFLGQYGDPTFASTDAETLRLFCLDHYADRVS
jgi:hypothetical protein